MPSTISRALSESRLDSVDARALLRHVLNADAGYLIAHAGELLTREQRAQFESLVARRRGGEPVAYITGLREFFSLDFKVTPDVLIPRPETELLVEFALMRMPADYAARVLDLGTGSGCIAISIARHRPRAHVVAVDSSAAALAVAHENARRHGVNNLEFVQSDWCDAIQNLKFDIIVSNPPYVADGDPHLNQGDPRFEPRAALAAGSDGLSCIRRIVQEAPLNMHAEAWLAVEHGYDQAGSCRELMGGAYLQHVASLKDLAGIERITVASQRGDPT